VEWHRCSPHATDCAVRLDIPHEHASRAGPVQTVPYRAAAVRLRREIASRACMQRGMQVAGCGAQLRSTARLPSQFRQSLPAARVVTHKTEASCTCFAAVG
jgi:hypothetical protein